MKLPIPKGKRAILVLGLPLGLAAAGGFVFMQMSAGSSTPPKIPDPKSGQVGPMLVLDDRVLNLDPTAGSTYKLIKIGVSIELRPSSASFYDMHGTERTKQETTELDKYTDEVPALLDAEGSVVAAQDSSQLVTPDGRAALKDALAEKFKSILGADNVLEIYLTNLTMQ